MWTWFSRLDDIKHINMITNIFTAIGTVSAVIVALWLARKDNVPKLRVNADIGVTLDNMPECLWLSCVNASKLPITCTGFAFNPNKFKKKGRELIPNREMHYSSTPLPVLLRYSDKIDKFFDKSCYCDKEIQKHLPKYKWLAKMKLKWLWRVVATTNIREFKGKLSDNLIEEILSFHFPENSRL